MNRNKKFLIEDTKERVKNIKDVTFKTINLRVSKRSNLTDEDYLIIRDTSRILLDDIKTIFNNLKRIEITEDECKDYLGFNVEETKTAIYSTRDMLKGLREKNTAVDEPKIYKLLNNSIDNYSEALELIDSYLNSPQIYVANTGVNSRKINKIINELAEKNAKEYAYSKTEIDNEKIYMTVGSIGLKAKKIPCLTINDIGIVGDKIIGDIIIGNNLAIKCMEDEEYNKNVSKVTFETDSIVLEYSDKTIGKVNIDEKGDYVLDGMFYFPSSRVWEITTPFNDVKDIFIQNELHNLDNVECNENKSKIIKIICDNWNRFNKEEKEKLSKLITKL